MSWRIKSTQQHIQVVSALKLLTTGIYTMMYAGGLRMEQRDDALRSNELGMDAGWKAPRELAWALPRPVSLKPGGIAICCLVAALSVGGLVAGGLLARAARRQMDVLLGLQNRGVDADGTVTGVRRMSGKGQRRTVTYRFEAGGLEYASSFQTESRRARSLARGDHLKVRFLPANPKVSRAVEWERGPFPDWLAYAAAAGLMLPAGILLYTLRKQRRLLEEGTPAPATVFAHTRTQHGIVVHYEFKAPGGYRTTGRSGPARQAPDVGDAICVLYDPDKPARNVSYPVPFYRVDARA